MGKLSVWYAYLVGITIAAAYKPVVIIHGILTGADSMLVIMEEIERHHPGTIMYNTDRFGGWSSLENAWHQVFEFNDDLQQICKDHPDGVILLGYSQGGLLARAVLQTYPNHCVKKLISLSSPQAGQYGTEFLHLIFPSLVARTAYQLFYTYVGQHTSVGNYWNDPHQQDLFEQFSIFLPYVNNDLPSTNSTVFRESLLKLDELILIGGPDDGVITPWESSHFGYYNRTDDVIPCKQRKIYLEDRIGLKTLDESGRLKLVTMAGVRHTDWHMNVKVIRKVVLPYLD
ncbi:lysosomal thioesterase PPT2 homolog isoform X1 [Toxorhynchites rutilus septentrionalis]|uniref:lysosomal thioesterase PPT2 homolog isoform X1 n=1 Tax=Toxorhynchites rutilus septentrionalis TaxID=329112 RepID=UPI002478B208|nr:lysosomal thioesterase PPT2 homolog isoform X1 [Toxorhynchites rutilus septentrionalis]